MELNMILWTNYLLLLFCYDENFLGSHHPVTIFVAIGCLVGSFFMMRRLVKIPVWGRSLRFAIATVIVFWTFVEVLGRLNIMKEIWIHPLEYKVEMISILVSFLLAVGISAYVTLRRKK
jgi:hypothetical protein